MFFNVKHVTRYAYSGPVFCEPLTIRLRPRCDAAQRLLRWRIHVDPLPAGMSEIVEADGHTSLRLWFNSLTCDLAVTATSLVETLRTNPFDYLLEARSAELPVAYADDLAATLSPYRTPEDTAPSVVDFADKLRRDASDETTEFLRIATQRIHESIRREERLDGAPYAASETLKLGAGSCRDFAVLFVELCRHVGLAARFTSGYEAGADDGSEHHLHAWAEVYVPGGGWRGYDPTVGLAVADRHVAVAAARLPAAAAPTTGAFRSSVAKSRLETQIVLRTYIDPPADATPDALVSQSQSQSQSQK